MRFAITLTILALTAGCTGSESELLNISEDIVVDHDAGEPTEAVSDDNIVIEEGEDVTDFVETEDEDEGDDDRPEGDPANCWFEIYSGRYDMIENENGGYSGTGIKVWTRTLPQFDLIGSAERDVRQGDDVTLQFNLSSLEDCGEFDLHSLFFVVHDSTENSHEWLKPLNDVSLSSTLDIGNPDLYWVAARNMYVTPTGQQLFYPWSDSSVTTAGTSYDAWMPIVTLDESGKVVTFTWTGSNYAPVGSKFTIYLSDIDWTDLSTGEKILHDWEEDYPSIEVTIVE